MRQSSHGQLHVESGPGRSCPKAPEGPPLSQSEAPTLSVCPEGLAGACHTVVLKPGCWKSEGAVGLYGSGPLRPRHLETLCDTEKGTPSSKRTQPASAPSAGHQPHPPTVALNGRGLCLWREESKRDGEGCQGWPWGGDGLCSLVACLCHQALSPMEALLTQVSAGHIADAKYPHL